jgi:NDP-sugar pyrophosphorylase family protein
MEHIDYGLSALSEEVFDLWSPHEAFDLAEVYTNLVTRRLLAGYEVQERFYEIGSRSGLEETEAMLSAMVPQAPTGGSALSFADEPLS